MSIALAVTLVLITQISQVKSDPAAPSETGISVEFIAAEQLRYSAEMAKFDFIARETGFSNGEKPSEKINLSYIHRVVRGENSSMITTESWSQKTDKSTSSQNLNIPAVGASRVLITPSYIATCQSLLSPTVQLRLARDWRAIESNKSQYSLIADNFAHIDPASVSFGVSGGDAVWQHMRREAELSRDLRPYWTCDSIGSERNCVRLLRNMSYHAHADLTYEITNIDGALVHRAKFEPINRNGEITLTRTAERAYTRVDDVLLPQFHLEIDLDARGECIESRRLDYSEYVRHKRSGVLSLIDLEIPDGAVVQRIFDTEKRDTYIWRDKNLVNTRTGEVLDLNSDLQLRMSN